MRGKVLLSSREKDETLQHVASPRPRRRAHVFSAPVRPSHNFQAAPVRAWRLCARGAVCGSSPPCLPA
eukprot:266476-Chlamydomonas_euryale.AAC.1